MLKAFDPHFCRPLTGASSTADFYPTVKVLLRHESADSEEDRESLGSIWDRALETHQVTFILRVSVDPALNRVIQNSD